MQFDPEAGPFRSVDGQAKQLLQGKKVVLAIGEPLSLAALALVPALRRTSVGNFTTEQEAVLCCQEKQPDLLFATDELQQGNGISLLSKLHKISPNTRSLIFLKRESQEVVRDAINAYASGVVFQSSIGLARDGDFLRALTATSEGAAYYPDEVRKAAGYELKPFPELSERETAVLRQLCQGMSNKEIAAELMVSPETVKSHVSTLISMMQVKDRTSVVIQAIRAGF